MGKLSAGLLGGFSGKVGTTVGAIVKGQPTIRAYQKHVTNPKSARQVQVRTQFVQAKDFVQENMPLCYRKQNMLGYGVTGNFQFAVGAIAKAIDHISQTGDKGLLKLPFARKAISNGATFREDLFGQWTGNSMGIYPLNVLNNPVKHYFGSDVRIEGAIVAMSFQSGKPIFKNFYVSANTWSTEITNELPNTTGQPGVCGWHADKDDCGDWNYIYSVDFSMAGGFEPGTINGDTGVNFNVAMGVIGTYPMESGNCLVDGIIILP